jgi:hypothetical protein
MPWKTPKAVSTEESPQPPKASDRPCAKRVSRATTSRSALYVPTSQAVRYRPPRASTNRPYARSSASVLSVLGSPMMTPLPPPRSSPARLFLYAIAFDRASASVTAASSEA